MKYSSVHRWAGRIGSIAVLVWITAACQSPSNGDPSSNNVETPAQTQSTPSTSDGTVQNGSGNQTGNTVTSDGSGNIQLQGNIPDLKSNLGEKRSFTLTVKAIGDFAGPVELVAEKDDLDTKYNAGADIQISVTPSQLTMAKDESMDVTVEVNVTPRAPDFKSPAMGGDGHFLVKAQTNINEQNVVATMDIPLQVDPVYEVRLLDSPAKMRHVYDRPIPAVVAKTEIRSHAGGVTLRFINNDTAMAHAIHGSKAIKHQDLDTEMAKAPSAEVAGGSFTQVYMGTKNEDGSYYCHTHGIDKINSANGGNRIIVFNADK